MTVIRDLVTIDDHAEFRYDVQISDYDNQESNLALLKSYLFTNTAPQGQESSIGILRSIIESYLNPRLDNRITTIANYGHGKSHLALVLANYFGKTYESPELKVIFNKIDQAIDASAQRSRYHEFRENRKEFLVIRLRGDKPQSLREQFVVSLEQGLKEHPATKNVELPFWYQKAEQLLNNLNGDLLPRANRFLEGLNLDVPLLIQQVRDRKDAAYDLCVQLFTELHGVAPDFKGEISQKEMFNWAAEKFCGDDKPLGGIFILFDEFSLYIQRYGQRSASGELQDLLNGIEDQKGKAVFVAFAQHDPLVIAKNTLKTSPQLDTLEKELNRIPRKVFLYSLMESVINAYLTQPESAWRQFLSTPQVSGPRARASNIAMDLFTQRYDRTLRWDAEKFDEIVTKGCFPLHPLTTAMLCDLKLQSLGSVGNPRTVLGFVFEQVYEKRNEPASENGSINWVLPVYLVDYFNDYLPEGPSLLFNNAARNLSPDTPLEQLALLKALLLQEIARLPVRRDTQVSYLSEATGLKVGEAETHLRDLSGRKIIRFDQMTKLYSFWPLAVNPHRMGEMIDERVKNFKIDWDVITKFSKSHLVEIPVGVPWGHSEDWAANQKIITLEYFTPQRLRQLIPNYQLSTSGELIEGKRGCVVWLLGETDDEVNTLRQTAAKVMDETFPGENPPAIVFVLPKYPCPGLISAYIKNQIVESFNQADRAEVGIDMYGQEAARLRLSLQNELAKLRGDSNVYLSKSHSSSRYVVPNAYRASVQRFGETCLVNVLEEVYKLTYRFGPSHFFNEFKALSPGANNLKTATKAVSNVLLRNSLASNREAIYAAPIGKRVCEDFLISRWQLLTPDLRLREPNQSRLSEAWNLLGVTFPAGINERRVKDVFLKLINPPYGFDYNTLTLFFCAWVGFHSHDIQVSLKNQLAPLTRLSGVLTECRSPKDFINEISGDSHLCITRRDSGQLEREIQQIIDQSNRGTFTKEEAQNAIAKLEDFCQEASPELALCSSAKTALENLKAGQERAIKYDGEAGAILSILNSEKNVSIVLGLQKKIADLSRSTLVSQKTPEESVLLTKWMVRVEQLVELECQRNENVQRAMDIGLNQQRLQDLKNQIKKLNLDALIQRVDKSIKVLSEKEKEFNNREKEIPLQAEIKAMDPKNSLETLYLYQARLQEITSESSLTSKSKAEKARIIKTEISQLELYCNQLIEAVDNLDSLDAIEDWQQRFYKSANRIMGTSLHKNLEQSGRSVQKLKDCFQQMDTIYKRSVQSPEESTKSIKELMKLQDSFQLSEQQKGVINKLINNIKTQTAHEIDKARNWYEEVEYKYHHGTDLLWVNEKLSNPPIYLIGEDYERLKELRSQVKGKMEQDLILQIESIFRKIKDPGLRRQCIEKLETIVSE